MQRKKMFNTPQEKDAIEKIYPQCVNISIDYGVIEKADNVYVIPSSFGWSDLGTGEALTIILKKIIWTMQ